MNYTKELLLILDKLDRLQADMDNIHAHSHKKEDCWICYKKITDGEPHDLAAHKLWRGEARPAGAADGSGAERHG